jgi:hypothetical protein
MPSRRLFWSHIVFLLALTISAANPALAAEPDIGTIPVGSSSGGDAWASEHARSDWWPSLGIGSYGGKNYARGPGTTTDGTHVGGGSALVALSYAHNDAGFLARLRSAYLTDFTSNTAEEVAFEAGFALGSSRKLWLAAGVSRLTDVADDRQRPVVGAPVELLYFPIRGLEIAGHVNFNEHRDFYGFTVAWAIARARPH